MRGGGKEPPVKMTDRDKRTFLLAFVPSLIGGFVVTTVLALLLMLSGC